MTIFSYTRQALLASCLVLVPLGLAAQTTDVGKDGALADKRVSKSRMLEEVVVTAQKREESIQDVPISIQAFSGAQLDAMGIEDQHR